MFKSFLSPVTKRHVERQILQTHPLHLFRIIQDVNQYSQFLPLCSHSQIIKKFSNENYFEATLTVGLPPMFSETYVSAVTVKPKELIVETRSIQSKLFDSLKSKWELKDATQQGNNNNSAFQTRVDFEVEITASDPVIAATLDQVLQQVAGRQVDAFAKRCRQLPFKLDEHQPKQ